MKHRTLTGIVAVAMALMLLASACGRSSDDGGGANQGTGGTENAGPPPKVPGFDGKTINLGVLTPLTGPANIIGEPLTNGNKVFFEALNAKGGIDGKYKVNVADYVKDNKYTAQDTITAYNQIKSDVVAFLQVLGTQPLEALQPTLDADGMFAGPATLDAPWYEDEHLMPILGPYQIQAINSIDYYVTKMDGKGKNLCTLTSNDPYGKAGKEGADFAAKQLDVTFAAQETFAVTQADFTAQINALQKANCDMVWLTSLPTTSIPILKRAIQVNFAPQWIGQSPTWVGPLPGLTNPDYLAKHFMLASEGVEWGDTSVPGMKTMLDAVKKYAPDQAPDIYFAFGWLQASAMTQILTTAVKNGDLSREGILKAAADTKKLTFDGMVNDETFGAPADRDPSRSTTLYKVTPDTAKTNGALTLVAPDAQNFTSEAAKAYKF